MKNILNSIVKSIKKDKFLIFLSLFFIVPLFFLWGRFGDPVIDCGREAYIPYAMGFLDKILFKDIVCIYGPVPYYLNALFVWVFGHICHIFHGNFGPNLNILYFIGSFLSYIFLISLYNLAKRFLGVSLACLFSSVILFSCIFSPSISNFIFPYSYAIVYALVFAIFYLYFLIKFIDDNAPKHLAIAALFLVLCIFSKYDFAPCALVILILGFLYRKNIDFKGILYVLLALFTVPVALLAIFIIQKVSISDIIFNFKMISNMAHSPSLQYFYSLCTGYFFDFKRTFMFLWQFLASSLILVVAYVLANFASSLKNKYVSLCAKILISIIAAILLATYFFRYVFLYIPLILIFYGFYTVFKKLKNRTISASKEDIKIYTLILFSILFSLKSLFGLFHELYGVFYLPFILLSFYIVVLKALKSVKNPLFTQIGGLKTVSLALILLFVVQNFKVFFFVKNYPVKTPAGTIFTSSALAKSMNNAIEYLRNKKTGKPLLVLPEGLFFNFVLRRDYPYFNTSFTPLDFDAYGEKYLIEQTLAKLPSDILFLGRSYEDYGKTFICKDFGLNFCVNINDRYLFARSFTGFASDNASKYQIYLFERKDNE